MTFPYVVVTAAASVASVWIARTVVRRECSIPELIAQLESSRADRLYPFVEGKDFASGWDDDALWAAIGGMDGIWKMRHDSGILITVSRYIKQTDETCEEAATELFLKACYLQWLMSVLCVVEEMAKIHIPSIPRIQARSCARLYCDLMASLDTVMSIYCAH
jgi:hypothetical protein